MSTPHPIADSAQPVGGLNIGAYSVRVDGVGHLVLTRTVTFLRNYRCAMRVFGPRSW